MARHRAQRHQEGPRGRVRVIMRRAAFALACACLAVSGAASATSLRALTLVELVEASELIVLARVGDVTDRVVRSDGVLAPRTTATFTVLEPLKGDSTHVVITAPAGVLGSGATRSILGFPRFSAGEEVVLFLRRDRGTFVPVGLGQGVFRVQRAAGDVVCTRRLGDVEIIGDTAIPERLPLADLRAQVRALGGNR